MSATPDAAERIASGSEAFASSMRAQVASVTAWSATPPTALDSIRLARGGKPSELAIESNCRDLARYALICQSEGLVPLVEPDVVLKGEHTLETAVEVNGRVHAALPGVSVGALPRVVVARSQSLINI